MNSNPLVSIIIPSRNRSYNLDRCLDRIKKQSYSNIEIIIVDGNSTDDTALVAEKYSAKFFVFNKKGDHRCAQRNLGVQKASGEYVLIIDDDMELSVKVIEDCVHKINQEKNIKGIIIPEESFGKGFWAQCKKLERSFYLGLSWMEAARFFRRKDYLRLGGYNEELTSGEDWDLSQRMEALGKIDRINSFIYHNEGVASLLKIIKKRYYYAKKFVKYTDINTNQPKVKKQLNVLIRFKLFFSDPKKLFKNPIYGFGMLFMKTCEFGFGGSAYLFERFYNKFFVFINIVKKNKKLIYLLLPIIFIIIGFNGYLKAEQTRVFGDTRPNLIITENVQYEYFENDFYNKFTPEFREPYRNQLERIKFFLFEQNFSENFVLWVTTFLPFLVSVYLSYFLFFKLSNKKFLGFLIWLFYTFSTFSLFTSSIHTNILTSINFFLFYIFLHLWYLNNFKNLTKTFLYIFLSIFIISISFIFEMRMMIVTFPFFLFQIIILLLEYKKIFSFKSFTKYIAVHLFIAVMVCLNFIHIFLNFTEISSQISSIIPLETWGNVYFQLINSLSFYHPFWNGGEAINFIYNIPSSLYLINVAFIVFTTWLAWRYRKNMKYKMIYLLPLVFFLFLSKQNHAPFENFYDFLYKFPYFNFSREASKYYYGYLLSFSFLSLAAFNGVLKQKINKYIIYFLLLIFLIPTFNNFKLFALGNYGNTTVNYEYNIKVYDEINNYISKYEKEKEVRVLWLPLKSTLQDNTNNIKHKSFISMLNLYPLENIRKNSRSYLYESLNDEDFVNYLKLMGFQYILIPDINNEKGMLSELKTIYKDFDYNLFIEYVEENLNIEEIKNINNYKIYKFKDYSIDVYIAEEAVNPKYSQIGSINLFNQDEKKIIGDAIDQDDIKINFGNCNNNHEEGLDFDPINRMSVG
ncbi:MAG: glycosyltransferase family 2 protein, partial [Promethearchaeota archaeon]